MSAKPRKLNRTEISGLKKLLKLNWKTPYSNKLTLDVSFNDFSEAIEAVNKIAALSEEQQHHPDIRVHSYKKLTLEIYTHEVDGLTYKDFDLAKGIEKVLYN